MKNIDIINTLTNSYPEAVMVRQGKANYLCIPTDEVVDGTPVYKKIFVGNFSAKATERSAAFDYDTARQDYLEWEKLAVERATKPKKEKDTGASERQAQRVAIVREYVANNTFKLKTATDIFNAITPLGFDGIIPTCGKILKDLANDGVLEIDTIKGKSYYTKD